MMAFIVLGAVVGAWFLGFSGASLLAWTAAAGLAVLTLTAVSGLGLFTKLMWILWLLLAALNIAGLRQSLLMAPLMGLYKRKLPAMSATEREALEAGSVWWDGELFSGQPRWEKLRELPAAKLTGEEQAFVNGPVETLCRMLNDWDITVARRDLPPNVWEFIRKQGFLGMIIPKQYGGLGFSAQAHSVVVGKIASRSSSAAVTVMVPNSLGPAELLLHYGTEEQKNYYLPRLADGRELPCFALTSPFAGSDASSIPDRGVVCYGEYKGERVLGVRVTWEKRYITLAPVATVLGLAFQLSDPEHLVGDKEDVGITLALIPANHPGVRIGRRHFPAKQAFQNGPTAGTDVFLPMSMIIGGQARLGQGWRMLMQRLAVGRAVSLPALASAAAKFCARTTGAYARLRKQFRLPVGKFEGVEEALARLAGEAYAVESARRVTAAALDAGHEPSVISALLKYQSTERQRRCVNDALDVHGGRAICEGPSNYLANLYQAVPVSITVEGANILTRTLIVFGQGAIRCHPWLLKEMTAVQNPDSRQGLLDFDAALCGHVAFIVNNVCRALFANLTAGKLYSSALPEGVHTHWYAQLARASVSFAVVADAALLLLGGELKRKEKLSGRFADILGEMYFMSCALKRFEDEGCLAEDLALLDWVCTSSLFEIQQRLDGILQNFPLPMLGWVLRGIIFPWGRRQRAPTDALGHRLGAGLLQAGSARDRLTDGIYINADPDDITGRLEAALAMAANADEVEKRVLAAVKAGQLRGQDARIQALQAGIISAEESALLDRYASAIRKVIDVDDFAPEELTGQQVQAPRAAAAAAG